MSLRRDIIQEWLEYGRAIKDDTKAKGIEECLLQVCAKFGYLRGVAGLQSEGKDTLCIKMHTDSDAPVCCLFLISDDDFQKLFVSEKTHRK
jgi:hypothetical protein